MPLSQVSGARSRLRATLYFKNGVITEPGLKVRSLAQMVVACAQKMASLTDSPMMKKSFARALELQGEFDPESVEGSGRKMQIIIPLQQGEYDVADRGGL